MDSDFPSTLFLVNGLGIGGSERKAIAVANELRRAGKDVHLAYLIPRTASLHLVNDDLPLVFLDRKGKLSVSAIRKLRAYVRSAGIRRIACMNQYPLIYALASSLRASSRYRTSTFLMINSTENIGGKERLSMLLYKPLMKRVDRIVFGCKVQRELWCRRYDLDEQKCSVIYNGVNTTWFSPDAVPGTSADPSGVSSADFVIGSVGQLRTEKNHRELIATAARLKDTLPNIKLIVVGEGPERARLEAAAEESGMADRILFPGQIADVRPILRRMDVFVLPSISETFSNAALEAMSMARPVILSDTGGTREMVRHGLDGYIYQQGDTDFLARTIEALARDDRRRQEVGQNARETVLKEFQFQRMIDDYQRLLA